MTAFPLALGVIGVLYPDRLRHADDTRGKLEAAADLQRWVHGSRGKKAPDPRDRSGPVAALADQLRVLPLELEGVDRVTAAAGAVGYALEQAAKPITGHARISGRMADIIASTDQEKNRAAALRIGCLVLFNALAFQERLSASNETVPTVNEAMGEGLGGLRDAWRHICHQIDYVPVFDLANKILDVLSNGPKDLQDQAIAPLVKDCGGRVVHTPTNSIRDHSASAMSSMVCGSGEYLGRLQAWREESQQLHHVSVPPARLPVHPITPGAMAVKVWLGKQTASERFYQTFLGVISVTALSSAEGYKP